MERDRVRSQITNHPQLAPLHLMPKTEDADGFLLLCLPTSKTHLETCGPAPGIRASLHAGGCVQVSQRSAVSLWVSCITFPREVILLEASRPPHSTGKRSICKEAYLGLKC